MSDPVSAKGQGIMEQVNKDNEDSLVAIVMHHNKQLVRPPRKARMTAIDSSGFTVEYKYVKELFWNSSGETKRQRVTFVPTLKSESEVRSVLASMSKEAEQDVPKKYPIAYAVPRDLPIWIGIVAALTLMSNPSLLSSMPPAVTQIVTKIHEKVVSVQTISLLWKGVIGAHIAEAIAMTLYCISRGASLSTTVKWAVTHFFVGFPTYFAFKKLNPDVPNPSKRLSK